jgi:hypothetical protein
MKKSQRFADYTRAHAIGCLLVDAALYAGLTGLETAQAARRWMCQPIASATYTDMRGMRAIVNKAKADYRKGFTR